MTRPHCMVVVGTRPEAIKMAPVVRELRRRDGELETSLLLTGQHRELVAAALDVFGIEPDLNLDLMQENQSIPGFFARALHAVGAALAERRPDLVLVQGDTSTVFAASLAAFYADVPVGHVEAGLRTGDLRCPFPEEANRRLSSVLSSLHFAPTGQARDNLLREGVDPASVHVTGNTVVDSLLSVRTRAMAEAIGAFPFLETSRTILVTAHRRENHGAPLARICQAVRRVVERHEDVQVIWPVHPHPDVRGPVHEQLETCDRIHLTAPLDYLTLVGTLASCTLVVTDSGGLQEEAPTFDKPVLTLRDRTERPEGVAAGCALLVGTAEDAIVETTHRLLSDSERYAELAAAPSPYGDGRAAPRIAAHVVEFLATAKG